MYPTTTELQVKKFKASREKNAYWRIIQSHRYIDDHYFDGMLIPAGSLTPLGEIILKTFKTKTEALEYFETTPKERYMLK